MPNDRLYLAFRLPPDGTDAYYACCLAMDAIGGLATSRLVRRLVREEQVATGLSAHTMGLVDGVSLGLISVDVADGADRAAVETAVLDELERFAVEGPTEAEQEASTAETERAWLSALASMDERADAICHYTLLLDDPHYVNTFLDRVGAVSPEQVRAAAAHWLTPSARAVVAYVATHEATGEATGEATDDPSTQDQEVSA